MEMIKLELNRTGGSVIKPVYNRVKSGNFGHHLNSDIHLQTV